MLGVFSGGLGALGVVGAGSAAYRVRDRLLGSLPGVDTELHDHPDREE
ncbi:hypothetical protein [Haloarchaeobius sp. DYHT-AS-18]